MGTLTCPPVIMLMLAVWLKINSAGMTVVIDGSSQTTGMPSMAIPVAHPTYQASSRGHPPLSPDVRTGPNSLGRLRISPSGDTATGL